MYGTCVTILNRKVRTDSTEKMKSEQTLEGGEGIVIVI